MGTTISGATGIDKVQDGTIVNADINSSAAIAGSKLVMPAGSVIQVVQGSEISGAANVTSTSFVDIGMTASITPISTSSKILVSVSYLGNTRNTGAAQASTETQLVRGSSTVIFRPGVGQTNFQSFANPVGASSIDLWHLQSYEHLDSPSSTSQVTYKLQGRLDYGTYFRCKGGKITLMEIAG